MRTPDDRQRLCDALYSAGHHLLGQNRIDDASTLFRTMLLADSEDERGWLALGACHEQLEQDEMAEQLYGAGAQIARTKVRLLVAVARLFSKNDDARAELALEAASDLARTEEEEELLVSERARHAA